MKSQTFALAFRLLDYKDRYQKFDRIETRLVRNTKDPRLEIFHLADTADIQQVGRMEINDGWRERRDLMLKQAKVYKMFQPRNTEPREIIRHIRGRC